jgi:hypothetical protein
MIHTKNDYRKEIVEITHILSIYKTFLYEQIVRLFPDKSSAVKNIISRLIKEKRVFYDEKTGMVSYGAEENKSPDLNLITAFWVLIDFYGEAEYHCPSDYPAQIAFFMDGGLHEIIKADYSREAVINHALSVQTREPPKRIIIVDNAEQIPKIKAGNILCFCIIGSNGEVEYFDFE